MAKSKETFNKREKEKQRQKQKQEKREKMEERKAAGGKKSLDDMMAYLDENGNIVSTPPDPSKRKVFNAEDIQIGVPERPPEDPNALLEGRVDYFNEPKGFGFIVQSNGERVFFHVNQLMERIKEGDFVNYSVERGPKGWNALQVVKKK